jgi:hypothetical protein
MRERLAQVLQGFEGLDDGPMDTVVRRFWSRTASVSPAPALAKCGATATVIDLALARATRSREPTREPVL